MQSENELRIDKWLWAVRIFKTRSQAADACKKGKVLIYDNPVKPSRVVKMDEVIDVKKNPVTYKYKVKGLLGKRLSAKLVQDYVENITPESEMIKLEMQKSSPFAQRKKGLGRPTKRERRIIDRIGKFKDRSSD